MMFYKYDTDGKLLFNRKFPCHITKLFRLLCQKYFKTLQPEQTKMDMFNIYDYIRFIRRIGFCGLLLIIPFIFYYVNILISGDIYVSIFASCIITVIIFFAQMVINYGRGDRVDSHILYYKFETCRRGFNVWNIIYLYRIRAILLCVIMLVAILAFPFILYSQNILLLIALGSGGLFVIGIICISFDLLIIDEFFDSVKRVIYDHLPEKDG